MMDLKQFFPLKSAKLGIVMTILVFTSACAHEVLVKPSNNDAGQEEQSQVVPEPETPSMASSLSDSQTPAAPSKVKSKKAHSGKRIAKHKHKTSKKSALIARHKVKTHKSKQVVTNVASVKDIAPPAPPAPPAPEIAPPSIPAPLASAGVKTEIVEEGSHFGEYVLYGIGSIVILAGLIFIAPRARRAKGPKRKLVYNG